MQMKVQRRFPAVRVRHGKRLPREDDHPEDNDDDDSTLSGPVTLTVTKIQPPTSSQVIPPTVTVFIPPTSSSSPLTSSTPSITTSSQTSTTSISVTPSPSVPANNDGVNNGSTNNNGVNNGSEKNEAVQPDTSSRSRIPTGSIIGIVLTVVLILVAVVIFLVRKRSVRKRLRLRGWTNKSASAPSFLWIEPKDAYTNMTFAGQNRRPLASDISFSGTQTYTSTGSGLPYIPPPAPPRPPPAHGSERTYDSPPASIPGVLTPGTMSSRVPVPSTPAPIAAPLPGSAKVKSTFIPTLPDELSISTGEVIRILAEYDDGWALCSNARGESGMVPLECLDRGTSSQAEDARGHKKLARASSLAASPYGGYA